MEQEYDSLEAEAAEQTIAGRNLVGFDLAFYCLDLTSTAWIRGLRVGKTTYTIFCQAEDREFEQLRMVFLAMTTSLVQGLKDLRYQELRDTPRQQKVQGQRFKVQGQRFRAPSLEP